MSKNEIKLTINLSDDLLDKMMAVAIKMNSMQSMGGLPMMLGGMLAPPVEEKRAVEDKSPMGFRSSQKDETKNAE